MKKLMLVTLVLSLLTLVLSLSMGCVCVYKSAGPVAVRVNGFVYRGAVSDRDAAVTVTGGGAPQLEIPVSPTK